MKLLAEAIIDEEKRRMIMSYSDKLRQEGRQEALLETAKNLIKQGVTLDIIAKATGLKKEQ